MEIYDVGQSRVSVPGAALGESSNLGNFSNDCLYSFIIDGYNQSLTVTVSGTAGSPTAIEGATYCLGQNKQVARAKRQEFFEIIAHETEDLGNSVENLLNMLRFEDEPRHEKNPCQVFPSLLITRCRMTCCWNPLP